MGGRQTRRTRWLRTARTRQTHPTTSRPMYSGTIAPDRPIMSRMLPPLKKNRKEATPNPPTAYPMMRPAGHREEGCARLMVQRHHTTSRSICTAPHPVLINGTGSGERSASAIPQPNRMRAAPPAARRTPARRLKATRRRRELRWATATGESGPHPAPPSLSTERWTSLFEEASAGSPPESPSVGVASLLMG